MRKLPKEPLTRIIDYTGSCRNIGQCRLVCKQWNELAEPLMFTKQIVLSTERKMVALLTHLYRKPANGKHVKSLKFDDQFPSRAVLSEILRLTFTPNMEYMTGYVSNYDFYTKLVEIAGAEPERFSKLKAIPAASFRLLEYTNALLTFKDTLQEATFCFFGNENNLEFFKDFKSLRNLKVTGIATNFSDVENLLNSCAGLEEVVMDINLAEFIATQNALGEWNSTHTRVVETVQKLSINRESRSDLLEYLIFKYPKISTFEMNVETPLVLARNNLKRMLDVIKKVSTFKVSFEIKEGDLLDSLNDLTSSETQFVIKDTSKGFRIGINSP